MDKAQALFSQEPARPVTDLVHADLQLDPYARYGVRGSVHQDCLRVWTASEECGEGTTAAAFWDGCVAIVWSSLDEVAVPDITRNARRFWGDARQGRPVLRGSRRGASGVVINRSNEAVQHASRVLPTRDITSMDRGCASHASTSLRAFSENLSAGSGVIPGNRRPSANRRRRFARASHPVSAGSAGGRIGSPAVIGAKQHQFRAIWRRVPHARRARIPHCFRAIRAPGAVPGSPFARRRSRVRIPLAPPVALSA